MRLFSFTGGLFVHVMIDPFNNLHQMEITMRKLILATVFLAASSPALANTTHFEAASPELQALMNAYAEPVKRDLKDPGSVQFRQLTYRPHPRQEAPIVCGEYNAKNSYGAYVGFQRFVSAGPTSGEGLFRESDYRRSALEREYFSSIFTELCR